MLPSSLKAERSTRGIWNWRLTCSLPRTAPCTFEAQQRSELTDNADVSICSGAEHVHPAAVQHWSHPDVRLPAR